MLWSKQWIDTHSDHLRIIKDLNYNYMEAPQTDSILDSISDGVFTVDMDWKITSFNHAAESITGIKRQQAIGSPCCEVFKSSMCEQECPLRKTLKTGKALINKTGSIITLKGARIPISVSTALLKNSDGAIIGGAETFRDLSEIEHLKTALKIRSTLGNLSSNSPEMIKIIDSLPILANNFSTILIQGETGTGKEVLAHTIHELSPAKNHPFVAVNAGALPDALLESELFGYKKGAFTGAEKDKAGRFALAGKGTLFLDEIGEITPAMQAKLLRVLQEREYEPLGATETVKTHCRIICATNRDLKEMVQDGRFRQDLYYRINVLLITLPPLRNRKEDIPSLADYFIAKYSNLMKKKITGITPSVYSRFYMHSWHGNIRELENVIERAVVLCENSLIDTGHLDTAIFGPATEITSTSITNARNHAEKQQIQQVLIRNQFRKAASAHELGINPATLYRKMKRYGLHNTT